MIQPIFICYYILGIPVIVYSFYKMYEGDVNIIQDIELSHPSTNKNLAQPLLP